MKVFGGVAALVMLVATGLPAGAAVDPSLVPTECGGGTYDVIVTGTPGNDTLLGTGLREIFIAGDGHDYIRGGAGNDCILGGNGNDTILGGSGNDRINGGAGNDDCDGGSGTDVEVSC